MSRCIDRTLLAMGALFGDFLFFFIRFRRKLIVENLATAFPEKSRSELLRLARENYRHYALSALEMVRSVGWNREKFRQYCPYRGLEHVVAATDKGAGAIFLTSHLGNWELVAPAGAAWDIPATVVVKRSNSQFIDGLLKKHRERTGAKVLWESGTALAIFRELSRNRCVAFVLDQYMGPPIGLPVRFFGKIAGTAAALALFLEKRDVPVLPAYSYRDEAGRMQTVIEPPIVFPQLSDDLGARLAERTQYFNDQLERHVRLYPSQWLWLHRRWKPFRGEARWKPTVRAISVALLATWMLAGCASKDVEVGEGGLSTTGIPLPPEPKFAAPTIQEVQDDSVQSVAVVVEQTTKPPPRPVAGAKKTTAPKKGSPVYRVVNPNRVPFDVGERLEIDMTWTAIPAGKAVMEVREGPEINGRKTWHFWGNIISSKLVNAIYKVDNTIESFADKAALLPYRFLLHMVESVQRKETRVVFDHSKNKAFYWAERLSKKWGDQKDERTDTTDNSARDAYTALYYARTVEFKMGETVRVPVYENGKNLVAEATPVGKELVRTPAGSFPCWKVQLKLTLNKVFKPMGDIFVWMSDDSKRYLVKFDAKLKVGSVTGTLVKISDR